MINLSISLDIKCWKTIKNNNIIYNLQPVKAYTIDFYKDNLMMKS